MFTIISIGEKTNRIGKQLLRVSMGLMLFGLAAGYSAWAQDEGLEILLPGMEYEEADLPDNPTGTWLVLHRSADETLLATTQVVMMPAPGCGDEQPGEQTGRAVSVPAGIDPILLLRGRSDLRAGPVRTVFLDDGIAGEAKQIEVIWGDRALVVRHVAELPPGDQPGTYRIELAVGDRQIRLHEDQWHGDGHWRVRWIGDLNRDGWPDLLVDASYKYSVYTTRLYLSSPGIDGRFEIGEAATFTHTAC